MTRVLQNLPGNQPVRRRRLLTLHSKPTDNHYTRIPGVWATSTSVNDRGRLGEETAPPGRPQAASSTRTT
jgi:hypothetical protein